MTPYEGKEPYAFVSYAHKDSNRALPIVEALADRGFRVWYDAGIKAGTEWSDYIAERLEEASCVIALISAAYLESDNCRQEIDYAIDLRHAVIPAFIEDIELRGGLRMRLGQKHSVYYSRHPAPMLFAEEISRSDMLLQCMGNSTSSVTNAGPAKDSSTHSYTRSSATEATSLSEFVIEGDTLIKYIGNKKNVTVPEGVSVIGTRAFSHSSIENITFPESLTFISSYAFEYCSSLRSVSIPKGVWAIGGYAFYRCDLISASVPRGISLGTEAFPLFTNITYR